MTRLEKRLKRWIQEHGSLSFRDFMEAALYDPEAGYYTKLSAMGASRDYYTSANIHPIFGDLLAEKFVRLFAQVSGSENFTILEIGAGTGQLAEDILSALENEHKDLFAQMAYLIVESSPSLRSTQQVRLSRYGCVRWVQLDDLSPRSLTAVIFSNELLDSFPAHRVIKKSGQLKELFVGLEDDTFAWTLGELTTDEIGNYLNEAGIQLREGQIADIAIDIVPWLRSVANILRQGFLVTIDYGDLADRLYAPNRMEGTLRCFYRHTLVTDPLVRVGEQDITASVDFTLVMKYGETFGLETVEFKPQREFLLDLGLLTRMKELEKAQDAEIDQMKARLAMKHFLMPGDFGENFKVLVQRKIPD